MRASARHCSASQVRRSRAGDTILTWPILALTDSKLGAGREHAQLDVRFSIPRRSVQTVSVALSQRSARLIIGGRLSLRVILPVHRPGRTIRKVGFESALRRRGMLGSGFDLADGVDHRIESQQGRGVPRLVVPHRLQQFYVVPFAAGRRAILFQHLANGFA